jgi:hypothetical protein
MNPHEQLKSFDCKGTTYTLNRFDIQVGQNLMKFVEYEIYNHDPFWIEMSAVAMQIKTGPRNGWHFSRDDILKKRTPPRVWFRWTDLGPFEVVIGP